VKFVARLNYSNVMATIAVFLAMGGGAYALTLPKDSVGSRELKKNSVGSAEVKDGSLGVNDLDGEVVGHADGVVAGGSDPPRAIDRVVKQAKLTTDVEGRLYVTATLSYPYVTCAEASCSATWGVYVDNRPVQNSGLTLQANAGTGDGVPAHTLFGVTAKLEPGQHSIKLARNDSGAINGIGQFEVQVGAFAPAG
jgi:hypothetical protein